MKRELTCINCPRGCVLKVEWEGERIGKVLGNACPKGEAYAVSELTNPLRNIASSVLVRNGELPLASVRLSRPIPKERIFDVMAEIKKTVLLAPVTAGDCVIADVLGLSADVIATRTVAKTALTHF